MSDTGLFGALFVTTLLVLGGVIWLMVWSTGNAAENHRLAAEACDLVNGILYRGQVSNTAKGAPIYGPWVCLSKDAVLR